MEGGLQARGAMSNQAKGRRNEWRSRDMLESLGYDVVRAAGSRGRWDLVAISPTEVVLVQVKTERWPSRTEIEDMLKFPCPPACRKVIHRWRAGRSQPDIKVLHVDSLCDTARAT